jgi:hypothetical protein
MWYFRRVCDRGWGVLPPRVGLKRVCLRMKAWYLTVKQVCQPIIHVYAVDVLFQAQRARGILHVLSSPKQPSAVYLWLSRASNRGGHTLCAEELSRDIEGLAAHHNDLLTVEQLLRDRAGQAAEQVALPVNHNDRIEGGHLADLGWWCCG